MSNNKRRSGGSGFGGGGGESMDKLFGGAAARKPKRVRRGNDFDDDGGDDWDDERAQAVLAHGRQAVRDAARAALGPDLGGINLKELEGDSDDEAPSGDGRRSGYGDDEEDDNEAGRKDVDTGAGGGLDVDDDQRSADTNKSAKSKDGEYVSACGCAVDRTLRAEIRDSSL